MARHCAAPALLLLAVVSAAGAHGVRPAGCEKVLETPWIDLNVEGGEGEEYEVPAGGRIELTCEAFATPQATVHWLHNGRPVDGGGEKEVERRAEQAINGGMAVVGASIVLARYVKPCASAADSGTYTCVARNGCASKLAQAVVKVAAGDAPCAAGEPRARRTGKSGGDAAVEVGPPRIAMWTDTRMERSDAAVQLYCRADRPAALRWLQVDDDDVETPVDAEEHLALGNGDLLVKAGRDSGPAGRHYVCEARNPYGADRRDIVLVDVLVE